MCHIDCVKQFLENDNIRVNINLIIIIYSAIVVFCNKMKATPKKQLMETPFSVSTH